MTGVELVGADTAASAPTYGVSVVNRTRVTLRGGQVRGAVLVGGRCRSLHAARVLTGTTVSLLLCFGVIHTVVFGVIHTVVLWRLGGGVLRTLLRAQATTTACESSQQAASVS